MLSEIKLTNASQQTVNSIAPPAVNSWYTWYPAPASIEDLGWRFALVVSCSSFLAIYIHIIILVLVHKGHSFHKSDNNLVSWFLFEKKWIVVRSTWIIFLDLYFLNMPMWIRPHAVFTFVLHVSKFMWTDFSFLHSQVRIGIIYLLSGFGGSVLSALFLRNHYISVGASGALFGLLGSMLSELFMNWTIYSNKVSRRKTLYFVLLLFSFFRREFQLVCSCRQQPS